MSNQLIHIVESPARHQWFEDLVAEIQLTKTQQAVVTLGSQGKLFQEIEKKGIPVASGKRVSKWLNIVIAVVSVKNMSNKADRSFAVAQGHLPSISAWLSCILCKVEYGIVHHQSPIVFFDNYRIKYPVKGAVQRFLYLHYVKRANFIQALSLEVYNSLLTLGYPEDQIVLIGHGIKMSQFESKRNTDYSEHKVENASPTILMVGRLAWEKNYTFAIHVISELVKKQPSLRVIIAGTGPDYDELQDIITNFGLSKHIELIGWTPDISTLMDEADAFLHVSVTESYGQVLLEACVSKLHVFAFPVGLAQDLNKLSNPFMHILTEQSPEAISECLSIFLDNRTQSNLIDHVEASAYETQDIVYVHKAMTKYLLEKCRD